MSRNRFVPTVSLDEKLRTRSLRYPIALERPARRGRWPLVLLAALFWILVAIWWRWA